MQSAEYGRFANLHFSFLISHFSFLTFTFRGGIVVPKTASHLRERLTIGHQSPIPSSYARITRVTSPESIWSWARIMLRFASTARDASIICTSSVVGRTPESSR